MFLADSAVELREFQKKFDGTAILAVPLMSILKRIKAGNRENLDLSTAYGNMFLMFD